MTRDETELAFRRPIILGLTFSILGELIIFLIFGVFLHPQGSLLSKFLWTVVYCGVGMGAAFGALVDLFVVNKLSGKKAIFACAIISTLILGVGCNLLCLNLDQHFQYFGGQESPLIFVINGVVMATLGGLLGGWLLFTNKGNNMLTKIGI